MTGTRREYNVRGERVIKKPKKRAVVDAAAEEGRRRLFTAVGVGVFAFCASPLVFRTLPGLQPERWMPQPLPESSTLDGNAVQLPAIELEIEEAARAPRSEQQRASVRALVGLLEKQGGPQLDAASRRDSWAIPWAGGWELLCTSDPSWVGLPSMETVSRGGSFRLLHDRMFVYGERRPDPNPRPFATGAGAGAFTRREMTDALS